MLDRYPPKDPSLTVRGPPKLPTAPAPPASSPPARPAAAAVSTPPSSDARPSPAPPPPATLISLERPFDIEELSRLLGETAIRLEVPREELAEALRRVSEFMGFGIYVYRIQVRPAPEDQLKRFLLELERVDYSPERKEWVRFEEKGRSDSPFGPTGGRR